MAVSGPDAYLATLSADKRATLEKLRNTIRAAAPDAKEGMSYGMPAFIQGKPIAGYRAAATFCSYYPMSGSVIASLNDDLAKYDITKGAIHFAIGKPLPAALVRKLVKARLAEIESTGSPKIAAKQAGADVIAFLRDLKHPLKKEIEAVRRIVLGVSPAIGEGIKWKTPSFRTEREYFATFNLRAKDSVQLIFHRDAKVRPDRTPLKIADPKGLMRWLGKDRAMVTLGAGRDILANRTAFEAIVRAWLKVI